jgi:16S rRNA processing protein RimM
LPTDAADGATPILVGIVARAHGLRGEVVVEPTTDAPERFAPGSTLTAQLPVGPARALSVAASRPFSGRWLVHFEGIASRDEAQALHGVELTVRRDQVAALPPGRYYRFELVGLDARTPDGVRLGRVEEVFSTGADDVLSVRGDGGEILIPMLEMVVRSVDLESGSIVLDPPPGLPGLPDRAKEE